MILEFFQIADQHVFLSAFILLLVGHAFADFPLQTDFMVAAKSPRHGSIWPWVLGSHCLIHGFAVALVLGNPLVGIAEAVAHFIIDLCKSLDLFGGKEMSFHIDQALHVLCKIVWAAIFVGVIG